MLTLAISPMVALLRPRGCLRRSTTFSAASPLPASSPPAAQSATGSASADLSRHEASSSPVHQASGALSDIPPPSSALEPVEPGVALPAIPADVVLLILDEASRGDEADRTLVACCRASRTFRQLAKPYLDREVRLKLVLIEASYYQFSATSMKRLQVLRYRPTEMLSLAVLTFSFSSEGGVLWMLDDKSAQTWHLFAMRITQRIHLSLPRVPFAENFWLSRRQYFFRPIRDMVASLSVQLMFSGDFQTLSTLHNLQRLDVAKPLTYPSETAQDMLPCSSRLTSLILDQPANHCGSTANGFFSAYPSITSFTLNTDPYSYNDCAGLNLSLLPHLRMFALRDLRFQWPPHTSASSFVAALEVALSTSVPVDAPTIPPSPPPGFSTFVTTCYLSSPHGDLPAVLRAFELSGLSQRIKADPRLARVEEVRFKVGGAARIVD
ncbi:hypothetical protein JCM8097_005896 [Rhodosporidiobolus ruineniae]